MTQKKSDPDVHLRKLLANESFPLSGKYDPQWVVENQMGPNALWLTEWLCRDMDLRPGMRVLDMGCGRCLSSVFLAREFGVEVWANDLWISAAENWRRIRQADLEDQIFPIHAEAHSLPYAEEFFDAIVCVDAYEYFGTDDLYFDYFVKFVKPGGKVGIVVPGVKVELDGKVPDHLRFIWGPDYPRQLFSFHSPEWWRRHWQQANLAQVEIADTLKDGWRHWIQSDEVFSGGDGGSESEAIRADAGRYLCFVRMIARRKETR